MKKLLFTLSFIISFTIQGQIFIKGNKSYKSSSTYTLESNGRGANLNILFAKKESGGMLVLKKEIFGGEDDWCKHRIKGNIYVYLNNAEVIICKDRLLYDSVDEIISSVYYLTDSEIEKLKSSNINTIRYSIKTIPDICSSSEEGNFSASNKENIDFIAVINQLL